MLCTAGDVTSKEGGQVQTLVDFLFSGRSGVGTPETLMLLSLPWRRPSPSSMCIHQHPEIARSVCTLSVISCVHLRIRESVEGVNEELSK